MTNFGNLLYNLFEYKVIMGLVVGGVGLRVKIGHHKLGYELKYDKIGFEGVGGVKKTQKTSDVING